MEARGVEVAGHTAGHSSFSNLLHLYPAGGGGEIEMHEHNEGGVTHTKHHGVNAGQSPNLVWNSACCLHSASVTESPLCWGQGAGRTVDASEAHTGQHISEVSPASLMPEVLPSSFSRIAVVLGGGGAVIQGRRSFLVESPPQQPQAETYQRKDISRPATAALFLNISSFSGSPLLPSVSSSPCLKAWKNQGWGNFISFFLLF